MYTKYEEFDSLRTTQSSYRIDLASFHSTKFEYEEKFVHNKFYDENIINYKDFCLWYEDFGLCYKDFALWYEEYIVDYDALFVSTTKKALYFMNFLRFALLRIMKLFYRINIALLGKMKLKKLWLALLRISKKVQLALG